MREVTARQLRLGHADIGSLTFNPRSRDDIPQVLQGLQYIYVTDELMLLDSCHLLQKAAIHLCDGRTA